MNHVLLDETLPVKVKCMGVLEWLVMRQECLAGSHALLHGYGSAPSVPPVAYVQWLIMHPDVWRHALQTLGPAWGRAFYPCRTCEGWALARPGCSACQDRGEVEADAQGNYPDFSFEPRYAPGNMNHGIHGNEA
jgi:hypothetical protein